MKRGVNCDSFDPVTRKDTISIQARARLTRGAAFAALVMMGGLAFAGPSGVLAWRENLANLEQRNEQLAALEAERDMLRNRVALLDPGHADPDLVGELLRSNLNVAHPDEVVITLK